MNEINAELLYTAEEHELAREAYAADHPDGPEWEQAHRRLRGLYLERAGSAWLLNFGRDR
jgi:hypothetical protein